MDIHNKEFILLETLTDDNKDFIVLKNISNSLTDEDWAKNKIRQKRNNVNNETETVIYRHFDFSGNILDFKIDNYDIVFKSVINIIKKYKILTAPKIVSLIFVKLKPGAKIPLHTDSASVHYTNKRVHIVLKTNKDVNFKINNKDHNFTIGQVVEINNMVEHGVFNNGTEERIHLIVDYI